MVAGVSLLAVHVQVYSEVEEWVQREKFGYMKYPYLGRNQQERISEEICTSASNIAGRLQAKAIFVYTRSGQTAGYVSRRRPDCPIFAVTGASAPCTEAGCLGYSTRPVMHAKPLAMDI